MDRGVIIKILWFPCLLVIMLATLLYWRDDDLNRLDKVYTKKELDFKGKNRQLLLSGDLKERLAKYEKQAKTIQKDLFSLDEAVAMIRTIADVAEKHQVKLTDFEYDIPKYVRQKRSSGNSDAITVPFESSFTGNYIAIGKFIEELEKKIYLVKINDIKFQNNSIVPGKVNCVFKGALRFIDRSKLELADYGE